MADRLTPDADRLISDRSLTYVYDRIFDALHRHEVAATFAVVGFFVAGPDVLRQFTPELIDSSAHERWLTAPLRASRANDIDGWYKTDLIEKLVASEHEIASHGLTHLPFNALNVDADVRRLELALMQRIGMQQSLSFETFVYPRNAVVQPSLLTEFGIYGFRTSRDFRLPKHFAPLENLSSEFNVLERSQPDRGEDSPVEIPSGIFLNWRYGLRRAVPAPVSIARWRHVLDHAERCDGVAHLWLHPHNLITGPTGLHLLDSMLSIVSEGRKGGRLVVRTQAQYAANRLTVRAREDGRGGNG
jgi:hypothetical protein